MPFGQPGQEKLNMNIDSLWSGGPFEATVSSSYNVCYYVTRLIVWQTYSGGNPTTPRYQYLSSIRDNIFSSGTGSMSEFDHQG